MSEWREEKVGGELLHVCGMHGARSNMQAIHRDESATPTGPDYRFHSAQWLHMLKAEKRKAHLLALCSWRFGQLHGPCLLELGFMA